MSGLDSDPDRVRHGHADGKPVVYHEFEDQKRPLPVEDLEQLRHLLLEREAVIGAAHVRSPADEGS